MISNKNLNRHCKTLTIKFTYSLDTHMKGTRSPVNKKIYPTNPPRKTPSFL